MTDWVELELAYELRPVDPPAELWARVSPERLRKSHAPAGRVLPGSILAAAVLVIAAATGLLWLLGRGRSIDLERLAGEELRGPRALDLRSSDPAQINRWVRANTGADPGIPTGTPVRLAGARLIRRHGASIASVIYRAGNGTAVLLIARADPAPIRGALGHGRAAWQSQGKSYALACSDPTEAALACLLCHQ